jgi:hypothetical protein
MCHALLTDSRFYRFLFQIDLDIATEVQWGGCLHCGFTLLSQWQGYRRSRCLFCNIGGTAHQHLDGL